MNNFLPAVGNVQTILDRLKAARQEVGSGAAIDGAFLRVGDKTGEMTYGQAGSRPPEGMRWAVSIQSFRYGYVDMQDGKPRERNVIPMLQGPKPIPQGGSVTRDLDPSTKQLLSPRVLKPGEYGSYEGGGPQDVTEITLTSIDEQGLELLFSPFGKSNINRIGSLLELTTSHCESPDGLAGYVNPVIVMFSNKYYNKNFRRDVWHWDFKIVDWLHADGRRLLSEQAGTIEQQPAGGVEDDAPWDDDLTDEERELLKAG